MNTKNICDHSQMMNIIVSYYLINQRLIAPEFKLLFISLTSLPCEIKIFYCMLQKVIFYVTFHILSCQT